MMNGPEPDIASLSQSPQCSSPFPPTPSRFAGLARFLAARSIACVFQSITSRRRGSYSSSLSPRWNSLPGLSGKKEARARTQCMLALAWPANRATHTHINNRRFIKPRSQSKKIRPCINEPADESPLCPPPSYPILSLPSASLFSPLGEDLY